MMPGMPNAVPRNVHTVLSELTGFWSPQTIAVVNDYDVRVVRAYGEFSEHRHPETDEFFMVLSGHLTIRMEADEVSLKPGDTFVVRRGEVHQPVAESETTLLLFEPSTTINTGDPSGGHTTGHDIV